MANAIELPSCTALEAESGAFVACAMPVPLPLPVLDVLLEVVVVDEVSEVDDSVVVELLLLHQYPVNGTYALRSAYLSVVVLFEDSVLEVPFVALDVSLLVVDVEFSDDVEVDEAV
jgi:hypothetical protein